MSSAVAHNNGPQGQHGQSIPDLQPRQRTLRCGHVTREIIEYGNGSRLCPDAAFIRGVINLRGAVVPVIDLNARFGRARTEISRRIQPFWKCRLKVIRTSLALWWTQPPVRQI